MQNTIKNKTGRKNKTNLTITWPSAELFTIKDMFAANSHFIEITLRVRLKNELENGKIKEIGIRQNGKGRPENVYAMAPVTAEVIAKAKESMVLLHTEYKTMKVVDVNTSNQSNNQTAISAQVQTVNKNAVAA
jgi:hypothetical protein